ncbi:hypothetical protein R6Q59_003544 [Mikania micrantha]
MIAEANLSLFSNSSLWIEFIEAKSTKVGFCKFPATPLNRRRKLMSTSTNLLRIKASQMSSMKSSTEINSNEGRINTSDDSNGSDCHETSTKRRGSKNIVWHKCSVEKVDRQDLLHQKGCVIWITGLSGSGKSTLACALTRALHSRGKLTYVLDGDNVRHGLNSDLTFNPEDRVENIRRIGEVAKLFSDAGIICIASVISPYRKDRDACRSILQDGDFIEVYMDMPLHVCEARDPKGLYRLARAGKIKGFTGVDDPYEPPLNSEIIIQMEGEVCSPPEVMADKVISYLDAKGYLQA